MIGACSAKKVMRLTGTTLHTSSAAILLFAEPPKAGSPMAATLTVTPPADDRKLLAPMWHTGVLVFFVFSTAYIQTRFSSNLENSQIGSRVAIYVFSICFELILLSYVWFLGVRRSGTSFADVVGGRWARAADFWRDIGVAFVFWLVVVVILVLAAHLMGENMQAKKAFQIGRAHV